MSRVDIQGAASAYEIFDVGRDSGKASGPFSDRRLGIHTRAEGRGWRNLCTGRECFLSVVGTRPEPVSGFFGARERERQKAVM